MEAEQSVANADQSADAGQPAVAAAGAAPAVGGAGGGKWRSPLGLFQRLLVRGESAVASIGITLAAILLAAMAATGWWATRTQQDAATAARAEEVKAVGSLLSQSAEALLAQNDLSAVRRLVSEAGLSHGLSRCRVVLPDGQVIASMDGSQKIVTPPATWDQSRLPPEPPSDAPGVFALGLPLNVAGRGPAELQIEANIAKPFWTYWETTTGVGAIGACALVALLLVYRRMRSRLKGVGAVREALLALRNNQAPLSAVLVSPGLGAEAEAWNELVGECERARKQMMADKAREVLGRRRQTKGDLDAACDAMSHGLLLVDDKYRVKYANGAAATFLRADRNQVVGSDVGRFLQVSNVLDTIREIASGALRRRVTIDVERRDDDGVAGESGAPGLSGKAAGTGGGPGSGVLRFSIRPVRREDSASAMVIIEDVTQQKAAEEARHSFVAQATHELRTPLTNIRLYVETAIEDGENDAAVRAKCLNVINGETRRLERIVGEMLSVAEIEAGSFKLKTDDVRLDALFDELRADFAEQARDKQIALTFVLPPKLPVIQGDRDKVTLALHNLVGNALKYTPSGGAVTVAVEADAKQLSVAVKDTGIGISAEDAERIFERFYRANDVRVAKITGTGLGLTLAREVARLHGGDISVASQLNQGSTFTLTVPVKAEAA